MSDYRPVSLERVCDRCGFKFVAGFIWVVDRTQVNICHDCQRSIDALAAKFAAESKERNSYIERVLRRLRLSSSYEPRERYALAALLGLSK